ncbi:hypothetical protein KSK55_01690 [Methanospirillum purgamenti]|uniref:Uncharacterized protein n=1 Tax=Methanospirillum hungatei TaxID=2203 RepID=A0A8F5VNU8_METHU|nr:hypothetical protein [Methanospirillum hungatei]QXO95153.1 hypothetical protein KSK55_01690 [Methanospirillum hungatei]
MKWSHDRINQPEVLAVPSLPSAKERFTISLKSLVIISMKSSLTSGMFFF